jgi:hypothetical protein
MKYRIGFEYQGNQFEHGAVPDDGDSLECIPNVGDFVDFKCHENEDNGKQDAGRFEVSSRTFSYGYAGSDRICDILIQLK